MVTNIDDRVARDRADVKFYRSMAADGWFFVTDTTEITASSGATDAEVDTEL